MDSITQATLGASIGELMFGKKIGSKGAIAGALIATIPDLDVLFHLFYDKYEMLSIHRAYSHSILFSFIGAFLIAYLLRKLRWFNKISYSRLYIFSWMTLVTHMILDAFTAYGTLLLLPFSDQKISWDSINVVDPVYTVPMLLGLVLSIFFFKNQAKRSIPTLVGLVISTAYLFSTLGVKSHVNHVFTNELTSLNIPVESLTTMPVGIGSQNWYGIARTSDTIYLQKYNLFEKGLSTFDAFPINDHLFETIPQQVADKMRWFAKENYVLHQEGNKVRIYNLQVDMRGVVEEDGMIFPTAGYFEVTPLGNEEFVFSSGTHGRKH